MRTLVVAPHPDDEILGCGGTLLRRRREKADVAWLIVTGMSADAGYSADRIATRDAEIARVAEGIGFAEVFQLGLRPAGLDVIPIGEIVERISDVFRRFEPIEVLLPHPGDAHTDHRIVYEASAACTKWFRYPSVQRVLTYETPSETDFGVDPARRFMPSSYVDISAFLERKIELMAIYASEIGAFPFPRSPEAMRALATTRGAAMGCQAAEAFQLIRERA